MCNVIYNANVYGHRAKQKSPTQHKSVSVFGNAKPVDTATRERAIEEKLRRQEEQLIQELGDDRYVQKMFHSF